MLNKTKAAMPGRSCHCIKLKHIQDSTLIDQVNYLRLIPAYCGHEQYSGLPEHKQYLDLFSQRNFSPADFIQFLAFEVASVFLVENNFYFFDAFIKSFGSLVSNSWYCWEVEPCNSVFIKENSRSDRDRIIFDKIDTKPSKSLAYSFHGYCFGDFHNSPSLLVSLAFLRWRRLISPCMAVTINCPVLSPGSFTSSIASTTSCGARACTFWDFSFFVPVAITAPPVMWWSTVYRKEYFLKHLKWNPLNDYSGVHLGDFISQGEAKPISATNTYGPLTTNVMETNAMAMPKCTQTHPKFTWRFLALNRHDNKAKPCRLSVEAATEREACRILAPHFILSLAARLPLVGMAEINMPICVVETETQEARHV